MTPDEGRLAQTAELMRRDVTVTPLPERLPWPAAGLVIAFLSALLWIGIGFAVLRWLD